MSSLLPLKTSWLSTAHFKYASRHSGSTSDRSKLSLMYLSFSGRPGPGSNSVPGGGFPVAASAATIAGVAS